LKIKHDFVTNSSSTAYIVDYRKPIDAARKMLDIFFENWKEGPRDAPHPHEMIVKKWLKDNPDFDGNIVIPWTCNYETFIYDGDWIDVARGRSLRVDTCRNENWEDEGLMIKRYLGEDDYYDENRESDLFLDLTDFKIKTRLQFKREQSKQFEKELEAIKEEKEKEKEKIKRSLKK